MTPSLTELKKLAEAATPGQWCEVDGERILVDLRDLPKHSGGLLAEVFDPTTDSSLQTEQTRQNAEFIAAANPQTILSLISTIERYEEALRFYAEGTDIQLAQVIDADNKVIAPQKGWVTYVQWDGSVAKSALSECNEAQERKE